MALAMAASLPVAPSEAAKGSVEESAAARERARASYVSLSHVRRSTFTCLLVD